MGACTTERVLPLINELATVFALVAETADAVELLPRATLLASVDAEEVPNAILLTAEALAA